MKQWIKSGAPWVWLTAGSVSISIIMVVGLLAMIAVRGLSHFWPADVVMVEYEQTPGHIVSVMGEITEEELVPVQRVHDSGIQLQTDELEIGRQLFKVGNRDIGGFDFRWLVVPLIHDLKQPRDVVVLERTEWGNFYGFPHSVLENGQVVAQGDAAWQALQKSIARTTELREAIHDIEKSEIGYINGQMERLRLEEKGLDYRHEAAPLRRAEIAEERAILDAQYNQQQRKLTELYTAINRDSFKAETTSGQVVEIPLSKIIRAFQPNAMSMFEKIGHYVAKLWEFVSEDPREANTEGGIFPAIFGT
ncbi:MAG TPA: phosphate ABC transporter, permease protein PstA, partial [Candidatus Tenderia sp.]|nr:phosphate ABC transporter, permease protein PstA [Candidatus Tenderia sp.]